MERLTMRDCGGRAFWGSNHPGGGYRLIGASEDLKRLDRLAAYEDTGLEPEEITTEPYGCVFYCNRKCNLNGDFCAEGPGCPWEIDVETAKSLLALTRAEKDGRLVMLPPNDLLTLEQLRKMDGEPVWVAVSAGWRKSGILGGWCLASYHVTDDQVRVYLYNTRSGVSFFPQQDYGISWWAYRRKPKDRTNAADAWACKYLDGKFCQNYEAKENSDG